MIVLQAGHANIQDNCSPDMRSGTGAPGEKDWTPTIATAVRAILLDHGVAAAVVDANFNCRPDVAQDWEAVVSIHYQANLPTPSGFFVGAGDPTEDGARDKSAALAQAIFSQYQRITGLPWRPSWNNVNVTHYYLFEKLSSATPFCLIECGVGAPGAPDHDFLWSSDGINKVAGGIAAGILTYLGKPLSSPVVTPPADPRDAQIADLNGRLAAAIIAVGALQKKLDDRDAKDILRRAKAQELVALL